MTEWRAVLGYEGEYEVSDEGQVRSLTRKITRSDGHTYVSAGRVLSSPLDKSGYAKVSLYNRQGQRKVSVSVLVLETFVGPRPADRPHACHSDDDRTNNRLSNLRWDTASANAFDKVRNGNHPQSRKTHCPQGHEYTEENTFWSGPNGTYRTCRTCQREHGRRYYHERKNKN